MSRKKKIGYCEVDSGQLMIVDSCYIDSMWKKKDFPVVHPKDKPPKKGKSIPCHEQYHATGEFNYDGACRATLGNEGLAGELGRGTAVVALSGYGDGEYPVYATYNSDGRIVKLEILMGDEDLEEEEDEEEWEWDDDDE